MNSNSQIFDELLKRNFSDVAFSFLHFLKKFPERIVFMKDFIGLQDFIFINESSDFDFFSYSSLFLCLDLPIQLENKKKNVVSIDQNMIIDHLKIMQNIHNFLVRTTRPLHVVIHFSDSHLSDEEIFSGCSELQSTFPEEDIHDVLLKFKKFPNWYPGEFPTKIHVQQLIENELTELEIRLFLTRKHEIVTQMKKLLTTNKKAQFQSLQQELVVISKKIEDLYKMR